VTAIAQNSPAGGIGLVKRCDMDENITTPDEISAGILGWYHLGRSQLEANLPTEFWVACRSFFQRLAGQLDVTLHWINAEDVKPEARGEFQGVLSFSTPQVND
jgi:hypothetical protein